MLEKVEINVLRNYFQKNLGVLKGEFLVQLLPRGPAG